MRFSKRALGASACAAAIGATVASCGGAAFQAGSPADGGPGSSDGAIPGAEAGPDGDALAPIDVADGAEPGDGADGAKPLDAGSDASDGAPSVFSCSAQDASTTLFCADFDHVASVSDGWSAPLAVGGGVNAFDTVDHRSPPNGYQATTPAITSTAAFAALEESITSSAPLRLGFSMLMKQIDATAGASATLASLEVSTGTAPLTLSLVITGNALTLQQTKPAADGGTITQSGSAGGIGTTAWTRVLIDLDRSVTPWAITVRRDNVVKLSTTAIAAPTDTGVQMTVGIVFVGPPSAGYGAAFDDVVLTTL